ncbi:MAG: DUF2834 domain-containing protein [Clostridiales bacterium]|nr:DUF2834 domain-containing protein [Clostridiales bacterium]
MKKIIYVLLSLIGAILPCYYMVPFVKEHSFDYQLFIDLMFLNDVSRFFSVNVLFAMGILIVFIILEYIKHQVKFSWMAVLGTCLFGVSFGLPFFLFLKEMSCQKRSRGLLTYQANYNRL